MQGNDTYDYGVSVWKPPYCKVRGGPGLSAQKERGCNRAHGALNPRGELVGLLGANRYLRKKRLKFNLTTKRLRP